MTAGAKFTSILDIPIIYRPNKIIIPDSIVPFPERKKALNYESAVCFYEADKNFSDIFANPEKYIDEFRQFQAVISPDFSMYRDEPFTFQMMSLFNSRALGSYYQRRGVNIIPNIRWGSESTYTNSACHEIPAFIGVEKHSIVAVGSYGCLKDREERYHFEA